MKRYLVIQLVNSGFVELANVGVIDALSEGAAKIEAQALWGTNAEIYATPVDELEDLWSYYI